MTAYLTAMAFAALITLPVFLPLRRAYVRKHALAKNTPREVLLVLFVLFCAGLAFLLFFMMVFFSPHSYTPGAMLQHAARRFTTGDELNLIPLRTIRRYLVLFDNARLELFLINLVGNIVLFIPIGFMLPLLWQRWQKGWKMLLVAVLLPVGIEGLQIFLPRTVDVDDVILNAAGILAGWGLCLLCRRLWPRLAGLSVPAGRQNG